MFTKQLTTRLLLVTVVVCGTVWSFPVSVLGTITDGQPMTTETCMTSYMIRRQYNLDKDNPGMLGSNLCEGLVRTWVVRGHVTAMTKFCIDHWPKDYQENPHSISIFCSKMAEAFANKAKD